jgi:tetratricopeptide (TPR) repeat protein
MIWKRLLFALIALLSFFVLLEGLLWVFGVNTLLSERDPLQGFSEATRVFEKVPGRGVYRTPARAVAHSFNYQEFLTQKPRNGFRLFTLGGSSAYGFPWDAQVAFTRVLGQALQAGMPDRTVEAVNVAAMSYGSHRLRILTHELLDYDPDLLLIYSGHNEFVERRFYRDLIDRAPQLDQFRRLLYRWRLYSVLMRMKERSSSATDGSAGHDSPSGPDATLGELLGLDVVREYSVDVSRDEMRGVREHFAENLAAIVEMAANSSVPVVICTVPSNLSAWKPNQSLFGDEVGSADRSRALALLDEGRSLRQAGDAARAVEILEEARSLAPGYAEIRFELGQAYETAGRLNDARSAFFLARDLDAQPARAVGALNDVIRELERRDGVFVVDVEHAFENASTTGLLGFNFFEDYVHPKPEAHRLIAFEVWKRLADEGLLGAGPRPTAEDFWNWAGEAGPPRIGDAQGPSAADSAKTPAQLFNLGVVLEHQGAVDQAIEKYRACLEMNPQYHVARSNLARLLREQDRLEAALVEYERVLQTEPEHVSAIVGLGETLRRMKRYDEAKSTFERATRVDPGSVLAWKSLGLTLLNLQRYTDAEVPYRKATELAPGDADAWVDLGFALLFQNRFDEADVAFRAGLDARPGHRRGRNGHAAFARGGLQEIEKRRAGNR